MNVTADMTPKIGNASEQINVAVKWMGLIVSKVVNESDNLVLWIPAMTMHSRTCCTLS